MLRYQQLITPMVTLYHIIPALTKVQLNIPCCRSFNDSVSIVPGVGTGTYKYRFFSPECWRAPALGVFVVCDVPFPCAFSSCAKLKVWAVSGAW
jgi:hypothetical protein